MRIVIVLFGLLIPIAFVLAAALATFVAASALDRLRERINRRRKRPKRGVVFTVAFTAYALALVAWLGAGLAAAVVGQSPSLHRRMHAAAGSTFRIRVDTDHYSFDQAQITIPANRPITVAFSNREPNVEHNFAIYDPAPAASIDQTGCETFCEDELGEGEEQVAASKGYVGPVRREFTFKPIRQGFYFFMCDVEDADVGSHSRYMWGTLTVESATPVPFPTGFIAAAERGLASAYHYSEGPGGVALDYVFSILAFALGLYLVAKRRMDRVARLFGVGMLGTAAAYNIQSHAALDVIPAIGNFVHPNLVHLVSGVAYVYAVILFPDGSLVPVFRRPAARAVYRTFVFFGIMIALGAAGLFEPSPGHGHALAFVTGFGFLVPAFGVAAQGYRFRRAGDADTRQRSKILLWAFVPALALGLAVMFVRQIGGPSGGFTGPQETELESLAFRVFQPVFIMIPVAIIVGILRYRMWDLDVVINKAILYGTLAAFIGATYVGVVTGIGHALDAAGNPVLGIGATVIVAAAFGPVRQRVQRFANRLVYGPRATPYEALAAFSHSLAATLPAEDILVRVAEAAARGIGATVAGVTLSLSDGDFRSVRWPEDAPVSGFDRVVPVVHRGERIGDIGVAKAPGDPVTARDERIMHDLAVQAGLALEGVRLTEQLQQRLATLTSQAKELALSRHRIVSAADAEQHRIQAEIGRSVERELGDIQRAVGGEPLTDVAELLGELADKANRSLDSLRDIAHGIFPPLLADKGAARAIDAALRKLDIVVHATFDEAFSADRYDPDVEATVYFCCVEALRSAPRDDGAPTALDIRQAGGWIEFRITPPARRVLNDDDVVRIVDRAEALGGTIELADGVVTGRIPAASSRASTQAR